jgi:hypothetical protein
MQANLKLPSTSDYFTMKKFFILIFFLPLFSFAQPVADYYIGAITYDTTNHTCCVEFFDSSSSNFSIASWYWYFGDGTAPVTTPDYVHCFTDTGVFEVCLIIQDSIGVSDTKCCNFNFLDLDSAFLDCDSLSAIFGIAKREIQFSPNPTSGGFTINGLEDISFELSIINTLGNIVYRKAFNHNSPSCDIENFSPGIYLVMIETKDGMWLSKKIIVQ